MGGIVGALIGTGVGFIGIKAINNFIGSQISMTLNFLFLFFILMGSFLVGSIAGISPALQAAKQNPVDALRG